ncbi:AAC(3) family N-acetyltransferase [Streptomyces daqingensis]|uniref:AAC(3) family N-acetyltransferase n=1 Tax=Streptomyces daqingensis TaxID=1472640 RepID=A0ABQ2MEY3_9ACTN|nr:AAC(3) family N-acetyltransferase [Streptomyces daqingensis]GGO50524.1 AAC(3) family N-acetyltransferase [Streptomyces daqingensis]
MADHGTPRTVPEFVSFLAGSGVAAGGTLLVHASLSGIGMTPADVLTALRAVLGAQGTLVVPAFTPENSDTSQAYLERTAHMSPAEREADRAAMKPFDPRTTPCPAMGALAEHVRCAPDAYRSAHPQSSFAAVGARAAQLMDGHDPECHLGERSPLGKLYEEDAQVLLLRADFGQCSAFHLAEYRARPHPPTRSYRCVAGSPGRWVTYRDVVLDDSDFTAIGSRMQGRLVTRRVLRGRPVSLFGLRDAVDHACKDMLAHRR